MLGFPILYFKGMRPMMFQLSGFYCKSFGFGLQGFRIWWFRGLGVLGFRAYLSY